MAHLPRRTHSILIILSFQICFSTIFAVFGSVFEEEFSEELLLKPLPDRKVLAHFHFETTAPPLSTSHGRHHHLFPKAIAQLVQKFHVKEMELSFTQGRWNYDRWGGFDPISSSNAKPPGVELWAVFDVPKDQVDASWKNLTHTLSGLFCASINFLESSTTYSAHEWGFHPSSGSLRYGTLPREAVCTENLTPWLKLLPCRDKAGLSALLDRPSIYRGFYHSQRLHLTSSEFHSSGVESGIVLEQALTVVLQPNSHKTSKTFSSETKLQPSWSLSSIFGRKVTGRCVLAKTSNVYLQLERGLVTELENLQKDNTITGPDHVQKFHVKEMELSFTQGRWNYDRWGGFDPISSSNAKPPGVELWAVFDVPKDQVDASWKNLTHTLSGLFCASINFLESSTTYSAHEWGFHPSSGSLRYGTLPREAVCTENLTPWLKLLPCRDKAGLSALLDRPSIYRGFYHSQRLHLTSSEFHSSGVESGIVLEQALTVVLQPNSHKTSKTFSSETKLQPSWSLSSIFGRKVTGRCVLAKTSNVYLQLERGLVTELENLQKDNTITGPDHVGSGGLKDNPGFELSVRPDKMFKEVKSLHRKSSSVLYEYSIERYSVFEPFDLGLTWKFPVVWSCPRAPLHSSRFLMGSGNQRGTIAISFISTDLEEGFLSANIGEESCKLQADIFQVVPWYIKVYYHTLRVFVDGQPEAITNVVEKMHVSPSEDKVSPGVMELVLKFPCAVKSAALTLEFNKGFLHIDEYPPDANQGFDIPSAVIIFPNFQTSTHYLEDNFSNKSPMLSKFQEKSPVLSYTEVLLVPLTTPDFSMPYNVITITCTVFALYFGSLLNVLRRRVGEEERILKNRASKKAGRLPQLLSRLSAKLRGKEWEPPQSHSTSSSLISSKLILKVLIVAGVAVFWQYYSE